jgi:hypothetical protein
MGSSQSAQPIGKYLYRLRYQTIERSFADAKELHGPRYCRFRGKEKVQEQVLMTEPHRTLKRSPSTWPRRQVEGDLRFTTSQSPMFIGFGRWSMLKPLRNRFSKQSESRIYVVFNGC